MLTPSRTAHPTLQRVLVRKFSLVRIYFVATISGRFGHRIISVRKIVLGLKAPIGAPLSSSVPSHILAASGPCLLNL
jgi:hypothetical protein